MFESIVSRKKIMNFAEKRHFGTYLGSAIGSVWAMICVKQLDSTKMAVIPFLITGIFLLCVVLVCLRN